MTSQLRFGILTLPRASYKEMVKYWRLIEALGFDTVWYSDHFAFHDHLSEPWWEAWTLLAALAGQTKKIRVGILVTNITYRSPALLAKEATTIDHISNGRLNIGIGAAGD